MYLENRKWDLEIENSVEEMSNTLSENDGTNMVPLESTIEVSNESEGLIIEKEVLPDLPANLEEEHIEDFIIEEELVEETSESIFLAENDYGSDMVEMADVVVIEDEEGLFSKDEKNLELNESMTLSGFTEPTVSNGNVSNNTTIEEMDINKDMKSSETAKGRVRNKNTVIKSRSLDDDEELIALFFTAL